LKKEKQPKSFLDKPFYEGGNKALRAFVDKHLVYTEKVLEEGIKGTVVIRYTINHKGIVIETKVLSGIGHGCDEAAQDVVKKLKFQVGKYRNIRVLFHKTIKIHFNATRQKKAVAPPQRPTVKVPQRTISYSISTPTQKPATSKKPTTKTTYSYTVNIGSK